MEEKTSELLPEKKAEEGAATTPQAMPYKPDAKAPLSKKQFWRLLLSIEISMLGIALDIYSIPVAVPALSSYTLGYLNSAWIGTAFLASFALGYLIWPRLCRGFGYKFSFAVAIQVYNLAASHAPSKTKTAGHLIAMRAISGAGAGGAYGLFEMILRDILPSKDVWKYMSASRMVWAVAAVVGPLASAALVHYGDGLLSYDLGVLFGTIGYLMALAFLNIPEPSWADTWLSFRQFDYLGSLLLTAATFCILFLSASGGTIFPWVSGHPVGLCIAGLALLGGFCFIESSAPDPLLHPSQFLDPNLLMTSIVAFFYGANLYGTLYYVPHFFQLVLDDGAFISSVSALPMMVAMAMGAAGAIFITSRHRRHVNEITPGGAALVALASGLMVRWGTSTSRAEAVMVLGLLGLGQGTAFIGLVRSAQIHVGRSPAGAGSRFFVFFQALGSVFGVACFAALHISRLQSTLGGVVPDVAEILAADMSIVEDEYVASMKPHIRAAYEFSMKAGWYLMSVCALAVFAMSLLLKSSYIRDDTNTSNSDYDEKMRA